MTALVESVRIGIVKKNTRLTLEAGTRCASAVVRVAPPVNPIIETPADWTPRALTVDDSDQARRAAAETMARHLAVAGYEAEWGPVPWDLATVVTNHVTFQVVVELQVHP